MSVEVDVTAAAATDNAAMHKTTSNLERCFTGRTLAPKSWCSDVIVVNSPSRNLRFFACDELQILGGREFVSANKHTPEGLRLNHSDSAAKFLNVPVMFRVGARRLDYQVDLTRFSVEQHTVAKHDVAAGLVLESHDE